VTVCFYTGWTLCVFCVLTVASKPHIATCNNSLPSKMFTSGYLMYLFLWRAASYSSTWSDAPQRVLDDYLFPYELCLLQKSRVLNPSLGLFEQPICEQDLGYLNLSVRCKLGSIQQHLNGGLCIKEKWGCSPLWKRTGLPLLSTHLPKQSSQDFGNIFLTFPWPMAMVILCSKLSNKVDSLPSDSSEIL
jgi:hypothetical protein